MTETRPITEDEVHAYVDGQLDPRRRQEVEGYLRAHPAVAQRTTAYSIQKKDLQSAFAHLDAEPLPSSLNLGHLVEQRLRRWRRPWLAAAVIAIALSTGGFGGWFIGTRPVTGIDALAEEAAASYAVYASDRGRPVELSAAQRRELVHWISDRLNRPVAPPNLLALDYQFLGGRLVATPRGAAALFLYENDRGARLALFIRPMAAGQSASIELVDVGDQDGCAWVDRGLGYIVVAPESYQRLLEISQHVKQQAQAPG